MKGQEETDHIINENREQKEDDAEGPQSHDQTNRIVQIEDLSNETYDLISSKNQCKTIIVVFVCLAIIAFFVWSISKTKPTHLQQSQIPPVISNIPPTINKISAEVEKKTETPAQAKKGVVPLNIQASLNQEQTVNTKNQEESDQAEGFSPINEDAARAHFFDTNEPVHESSPAEKNEEEDSDQKSESSGNNIDNDQQLKNSEKSKERAAENINKQSSVKKQSTEKQKVQKELVPKDMKNSPQIDQMTRDKKEKEQQKSITPKENNKEQTKPMSSEDNDKNQKKPISGQKNKERKKRTSSEDKDKKQKPISELKDKEQKKSMSTEEKDKNPKKPMTPEEKKEAARLKRQALQKKRDAENILRFVKKNPYLADEYTNISRADLLRARRFRYIVSLNPDRDSTITILERKYFEQKYNVSHYEEKPFCLVIPTFNNKPKRRYLRNIRSVIMQEYRNYRFVVIDDGSTDGTGKLIEDFLKTQRKVKAHRYKVVIHEERHFAMPNLRWAAKNFCKPDDIFIIVDGDDELLGRQVLKLYNAIFQREQVWFLYSNFLGSNGKVGYSRPFHPQIIEDNSYREYTFAVSHLRAYYTRLFLNIRDQDLQDENGTFLTSANDMAICVPVMEMSHKRVLYLPELTYYYNFNTGFNVHKGRLQEQRRNNLRIRAKQRYSPLQTLYSEPVILPPLPKNDSNSVIPQVENPPPIVQQSKQTQDQAKKT